MNNDPTGIAARACGRDITRNRHGGNAQSNQAWNKIRVFIPKQQRRVYDAIERSESHGATCREVASDMGVGMNQISGRFSELAIHGYIEKTGTRDGCAVYVSTGKLK